MPESVKPAASHLTGFDVPLYNVWKLKKSSQSAQIRWLSALGWTQEEVGEALDMTKQRISQVCPELDKFDETIVSQLTDGHPVEDGHF